ncbi:MAG: prephenate dehydratase, partial [Cyclobacteriaceae bacterium]|nr:prephenate dehydratase [Cyclobacteriaceae bacterium]
KRMGFVKQVGELKRESKATIYRPEREKAIIDRLVSRNTGMLNRLAIEAIFLEIFAVSRNYELPERIAFLGPEGSFTHQAAESRYGAMSDYLALDSISAVFEAVATSRARFGVVPIENNQEGTVQETIDFLSAMGLTIAAEVVLPIHFCIASLEQDLKDVKVIYSRDIAFRQCKNFINDYFHHEVKLIPVSSTSRACRMAMEEEKTAAICAPIAARQYRLPILYNNIQDSADNQTRFLIIGQNFVNGVSGEDKTSLIARLPDKPGALVSFLKNFEDAGINLCKVESRPAKIGSKFKYFFFVELDGHYMDPVVQETIEPYKDNISWLGSYVKMC